MKYVSSLEGINAEMLQGGFFVGWPNPPSPETHLKLLQGSYRVVLAIDEKTEQVVGFIHAVSDGVLMGLYSIAGSIAGLPGSRDWNRTGSTNARRVKTERKRQGIPILCL